MRAPQAGAARYIGTKLNHNFRLIYKDFELLEYKEEGESIEPKYFTYYTNNIVKWIIWNCSWFCIKCLK
jgi:hypothetical protein